EQHYQPNGHDENPDRDRRDKLQHRSGSSRDASHAEASILSLRQIPTGRKSLGFGRSPSQEPPEQPCRGACQCHKNSRHHKPGRTGRGEDLGPAFCTTQPQKNTPRSVRRVPATISTVGPHLPERVDRPAPPLSLESTSRSTPKPQSLHIGISLSLVTKGAIHRVMVK